MVQNIVRPVNGGIECASRRSLGRNEEFAKDIEEVGGSVRAEQKYGNYRLSSN